MNILETIFTSYDHLLADFSPKIQFLAALAILVLLIFSFVAIIKKGHWIFIVLFAIFFPGGWPAIKVLGNAVWSVIKFLLVRMQINI